MPKVPAREKKYLSMKWYFAFSPASRSLNCTGLEPLAVLLRASRDDCESLPQHLEQYPAFAWPAPLRVSALLPEDQQYGLPKFHPMPPQQ